MSNKKSESKKLAPAAKVPALNVTKAVAPHADLAKLKLKNVVSVQPPRGKAHNNTR